MENMDKFKLMIEIYKCIALTAIGVVLLGIFLRTPVPFTVENIQSKAVNPRQIPIVRVEGGSMSVDVDNTVEVQGSVSLEGQ
jgi:hypothetical protein